MKVQASFVASEVLRRYYVGVHGLRFTINDGAVAANNFDNNDGVDFAVSLGDA